MLPPSVHGSPEPGTDGVYRWAPGAGALALAALPAWVAEAPTTTPAGGPHHEHEHERRPGRQQRREGQPLRNVEEWRELWRRAGVEVLDAEGERAHLCPWHDDHRPSLRIDSRRLAL